MSYPVSHMMHWLSFLFSGTRTENGVTTQNFLSCSLPWPLATTVYYFIPDLFKFMSSMNNIFNSKAHVGNLGLGQFSTGAGGLFISLTA